MQNHLLAALPPSDRERVLAATDVTPLKLKQILHNRGEPVEYVYFPGGGFCSIVTVLEDGGMVEVATIGREGALGVPAALDEGPLPSLTMVKGETETCYRMSTDAFRREMDRRGAFWKLLTRYSNALLGVIMQATACNAVHSIEQRLARWLLQAHDRAGKDEFPLTQELVAMMLGVTRPTVTVVAGTLQRAGLISYHHGRVTVVDRENLAEASCECYQVTTDLLRAVTDGSRTESR